MGILDTLKEAVGLIQKVDNIDLYRRMLELQTQVYSLVEENRALKERLTVREQLTFKGNAYWMGDSGPFCSRCWDVEWKLVRIHASRAGIVPSCVNCATSVSDPNAAPEEPGRATTAGPGDQGWMGV